MLKMRLQRIGRRNDAAFRLIVTDSRRGPKSGKHIDRIGSYNPKLDQIQIDADKAKAWIGKGVQVSDTVHNLLVGEGVIEGKKRNVLPRKAPIVREDTDENAAATDSERVEAPEAEESTGEGANEAPESEAVTEEEAVSSKESEKTDAPKEEDTAVEVEPSAEEEKNA